MVRRKGIRNGLPGGIGKRSRKSPKKTAGTPDEEKIRDYFEKDDPDGDGWQVVKNFRRGPYLYYLLQNPDNPDETMEVSSNAGKPDKDGKFRRKTIRLSE